MRPSYVGLAVGLIVMALVSSSMFLGSMLIPEIPKLGQDSHDDGILRPGNEDSGMETDDDLIQIETIVKSDRLDFGYQGTTFIVIQTEEEWQALWRRAETGEPPAVNFGLHTVLVSLLGVRHSGGYSIEIVAVVHGMEGSTVQVDADVPGFNCAVITVLTYPVHVVKIPKAEGLYEFILEETIYSCDS